MADPTTQVTRLAYAAADNLAPLFCDDPAAQAKGTTDFCFDWRAPVQWGGTLPVVGTPQPVMTFANLALNTSPVLGRDQEVSLRVVNGGGDPWPTDGRGYRGGARLGATDYVLRKAGVDDGKVMNPKSELFRDFYVDLWFTLTAEPVQYQQGLIGRGAGVEIDYGLAIDHATRQPIEWFTAVRGPARAVGALVHIGHHLAFDTTADTATSRMFCDGVEIGAAVPHRKPSDWVENDRALTFNGMGGYGGAQAVFARFSRTFTKWPGQTALDPLKLHQDEERWRGRLA
ncbi:hypothetical protein [Sphingomonas paucimobilis]|uniref:Uncharacterized protein n=1 Tax=Sphingomonas paucimobilis TaxID=13689 RepID=A0A7T3A9I1_SPHPI|nr:hypothetical protein [Sphingomonas paucimobilis]QPT08600.1 hypothetical protein I6G38_18085 [Sphingomonas paucimobilis]